MGALVGPLFSATKFRRSPETEPHPAIAVGKILGTVLPALLAEELGLARLARYAAEPAVAAPRVSRRPGAVLSDGQIALPHQSGAAGLLGAPVAAYRAMTGKCK